MLEISKIIYGHGVYRNSIQDFIDSDNDEQKIKLYIVISTENANEKEESFVKDIVQLNKYKLVMKNILGKNFYIIFNNNISKKEIKLNEDKYFKIAYENILKKEILPYIELDQDLKKESDRLPIQDEPYLGYKRTGWAIDRKPAELVVNIFKTFLSTRCISEVIDILDCCELNNRDIYMILRNVYYTGLCEYGDKSAYYRTYKKGIHKKIVPFEIWLQVQGMLTANSSTDCYCGSEIKCINECCSFKCVYSDYMDDEDE